jgi:dihydrofolate synthase/folylpolyglutamate synthase
MITSSSTVAKVEQHLEKPIHYGDIIARLETAPVSEYSAAAVERMAQLDAALGHISQKITVILVAGTNGKSLAIHFAAKLFREEGISVGECYSSHILSYNERISLNKHVLNNKTFSEAVVTVLAACDREKIAATAFEITTMAALVHFVQEGVSVALVETALGGCFDATAALPAKLVAITRIAEDQKDVLGQDLDVVAAQMVALAHPGAWVVSAEQSKLRLQKMKDAAQKGGINWAMPLRKTSALPYIFEQLYGRSASLGERIAQMYQEKICGVYSPFLMGSSLSIKQGQRGRPTLEAKRQATLNPVKSLKSFWAEQLDLLRGRFELLDKEKPTVLLDNADNMDAFNNLLLGIRLLHYQRPLKGFVLIVGLAVHIDLDEAMKALRYLLRKVGGVVFFIELPGGEASHSVSLLMKKAETFGLNAQAFLSLKEAFDEAKVLVDERYGLVAAAGSARVVASYWRTVRDIKRF